MQIEMQFLPDLYVTCDACHGARYNRETLDIRYRGKNIAEVLDMTVEEAAAFFERVPSIAEKLQTLIDVGLGYIRLGQPATTGTELEFVIMVIAVSCVKLLSAHNSTQHTSRKHKV
jgi:Excinuclease ABC subunit A